MAQALKTVSRVLSGFHAANHTRAMSAWANVKMGPPDPILGLTQAFQEDSFPNKVNLGVGAYRCDDGKPFVLPSVKKAAALIHDQDLEKEYAPITGYPHFRERAAKLAWGANSPLLNEERVAVAQTISGTGALRLGAEFLKRFYEHSSNIWVPSPTWANHNPIFQDAGINVQTYKYYDAETCGLDLDGMLNDMKSASNKSIFLFHASAHNPTGVDPSAEQWQQIAQVAKDKEHFCFFDMAYQGFASGDTERDAVAVRSFAEQGLPLLVTQSFAKNFGLYGERVGTLQVVCKDKEEQQRIDSQLKILIRPMYSNPPINGARLVSTILGDEGLTSEWKGDVQTMANRIISMRTLLKGTLEKLGSSHNWDHITNQIGMFTFTGLKPEQVEKMIKEHHIYLTKNGRISMAGVTSANVEYIANAIHDVTK